MSEFCPNWPHGHEIIFRNYPPHKARILATDLPGVWPIAACSAESPDPAVTRFKKSGVSRDPDYTIRNAPAPKMSGVGWCNIWRDHNGTIRMGTAWATRELALSVGPNNGTRIAVARFDWLEGEGLS